jgi:hypothetical protein
MHLVMMHSEGSRNLNANSNPSPLSACNAMQPHFRTTAPSPLLYLSTHTIYSCNKSTGHTNTIMYTSFGIKNVMWEDDVRSRHFHSTEQILPGESNSSSASPISSHCMKPEGSVPCLQQPAIHPFPEILVQSTCHQHLHVRNTTKKTRAL